MCKGYWVRKYFYKYLMEKKVIDFFNNFFKYFLKSGVKNFLKWFINKCSKDTFNQNFIISIYFWDSIISISTILVSKWLAVG